MRELNATDAIIAVLSKQDTCSLADIKAYKIEYEQKNPDVYVDITRDEIHNAKTSYKKTFFWLEDKQVFVMQESIQCPCCNETIYKYPNTIRFEAVNVLIINHHANK